MRLVFIRHADPDYARDSLTEKGKREAQLLAKRAASWQVDDVYVSTHGRAMETAAPCLAAWGKEGTPAPWLREFVLPEKTEWGWEIIPWDYFPADWTAHDENFSGEEWLRLVPSARERYETACAALDGLLKGYGYEREGRFYRVKAHSDKTVVFFCHFGISMMLLSHLLNIPAETLLHGFYLAPASITVLNTEERRGDEAYFRAERLGDCAHLLFGGEEISPSGYFAEILREIPFGTK